VEEEQRHGVVDAGIRIENDLVHVTAGMLME